MVETLLKDVRYALRGLCAAVPGSSPSPSSRWPSASASTRRCSRSSTRCCSGRCRSRRPSTLVDVFTTGGDGDEYATSSYADFADLKAQNTVFTDMTGYSPMMAPLSLGDRSRVALGQIVTANHFALLGVQPQTRPAAGAGRRRRRRRAGRGALGSDVAARVRRRSRRRRPHAHAARPGLHGRRRGAGRRSPASCRCSRRSCGCRSPTSRKWSRSASPTACRRPSGARALERRGMRWMFVKGRLKDGRHRGAGPRQRRADRRSSSPPPIRRPTRTRTMSAVPTDDVRLLVPQAGGVLSLGAAGVMAHRRPGAAHRLRQRRRHAAGARLGAAPRDQRAAGGGRQPRPADPAAAGRGPGARRARRGGVGGVRVGAHPRAASRIELPLPVDVALDLRLDARVLGLRAGRRRASPACWPA